MGNPGGSCPLEEGAPPKTVLLGYTFQCQLSQAISRSGTLSTVSPKTVLLGYTFQCQPSHQSLGNIKYRIAHARCFTQRFRIRKH